MEQKKRQRKCREELENNISLYFMLILRYIQIWKILKIALVGCWHSISFVWRKIKTKQKNIRISCQYELSGHYWVWKSKSPTYTWYSYYTQAHCQAVWNHPDLEGCSADKNLRTSFGLNFLLQYIAFLEEAPACWHSNWKSQLIFAGCNTQAGKRWFGGIRSDANQRAW